MIGSDFDIGLGIAPVDLSAAANTGKRMFVGGMDYLGVLFVGAASAVGEGPVLTLKQHTASSSGTSSNLAVITTWWRKSGTTLANTETWSKQTQAASATLTLEAQKQQLVYFKVDCESLASGNSYVSVDIADVGAGAQAGCLLYVTSGLGLRDAPENMLASLR